MKRSSVLTPLLGVLAATVFLAAPARPCGAKQPVSLESITGPFGTYTIEGFWTQRYVRVANRSDTPFSAEVLYATQAKGRGREEFLRRVRVEPHSVRRMSLAVRAGMLPVAGRQIRGLDTVEETWKLRDAVSRKLITNVPNIVTELRHDRNNLLIIKNSALDDDNDTHLADPAEGQLGDVHIVRSTREQLPDRWYGYAMFDMALLGGYEMHWLRGSQVQALLDWVGRGGVLVLTASKASPQMLQGALSDPAGVSPVGMHYVESLAIRKTGDPGPETIPLSRPGLMIELCPTTAEVLYEANGLPLLTQRAYGHGSILTLAVPISALAEPGAHDVSRAIRFATRERPPVAGAKFVAAGPETLQQIAGRPGPGRAVPVGILTGMIGVTVVVGGLLWFFRRGEWLWWTLVPLALLLAAGLYIYGTVYQAEGERLSYVGLICGLQDGRARVQEIYGYYSGPASQRPSFSAGDPAGVIRDTGDVLSGALATQRTECGPIMSLPLQWVPVNSTRSLAVDSVLASQGLTGALSFGPDGLAGTLSNHLPADVTDAVIYAGRITYRLDDLPAGQQTPVTVSDTDRLSRVRFFRNPGNRSQLLASGQFVGGLTPDARRNASISRIVSTPGRGRRLRKQPVLIGKMNRSMLDPLPNRDIDRNGWCDVVWPLKLQSPPSGTPVLIPVGFVDLEYQSVKPLWNHVSETFNPTVLGFELSVLAQPPAQIARLDNASATLRIGVSAAAYRMIVSGVVIGPHGKRATTTLATFANPTGIKTVRAERADRFRGPDGRYVFAVKIEPLSQQDRLELKTQAQLDSVEVTLEGTVP